MHFDKKELVTTMSTIDRQAIIDTLSRLVTPGIKLTALADELGAYSLPEGARDRAFNLSWHDWLNLGSLVEVSRAIVAAASARRESRGAHFRTDYPETGDLAASTYTRVRRSGGELHVDAVPVRFSRVRPGESMLDA